jgi:hypothetical protein
MRHDPAPVKKWLQYLSKKLSTILIFPALGDAARVGREPLAIKSHCNSREGEDPVADGGLASPLWRTGHSDA